VSVSGLRVSGHEKRGSAGRGSAAARRRDCALSQPRGLRANTFGLQHLDGAIGADGYGRFYLTRDGVGFCVRPHRYALAIVGGRVAAGALGLHECDNPFFGGFHRVVWGWNCGNVDVRPSIRVD
jgi:hypothetical protein